MTVTGRDAFWGMFAVCGWHPGLVVSGELTSMPTAHWRMIPNRDARACTIGTSVPRGHGTQVGL